MRYLALLIAVSFGFSGPAFAATLTCSQPGSNSGEVGDNIFDGYDIYASTADLTARITTRYKNSDDTKHSVLTDMYKNGASGNVVVSYTVDGTPLQWTPTKIENNQIVTIRRNFFGWGSNGHYDVTFDDAEIRMFCSWSE
jgi:hypothetical protein